MKKRSVEYYIAAQKRRFHPAFKDADIQFCTQLDGNKVNGYLTINEKEYVLFSLPYNYYKAWMETDQCWRVVGIKMQHYISMNNMEMYEIPSNGYARGGARTKREFGDVRTRNSGDVWIKMPDGVHYYSHNKFKVWQMDDHITGPDDTWWYSNNCSSLANNFNDNSMNWS